MSNSIKQAFLGASPGSGHIPKTLEILHPCSKAHPLN